MSVPKTDQAGAGMAVDDWVARDVTQAQIAGAFLWPFVPELQVGKHYDVGDGLRSRRLGLPVWGRCYMPPASLSCEQVAIAVRLRSVPSIADQASCLALRQLTRINTPYGASLPADVPTLSELYAARDSLGHNYHARVFADALLARGHWLGEPLALWLSRPRGYPKKRWQLKAARALVDAVPDVYGLGLAGGGVT